MATLPAILFPLTRDELTHALYLLDNSPSSATAALEEAIIETLAPASARPRNLTPVEWLTKATCEASLHDFVKTFWDCLEPDRAFVDGWHIRAICLHLEGLFHGVYDSMLVMCPPGCMKSLLCSVFYPAWTWVKNPAFKTLSASYEQSLSTRDSWRCRTILQNPLFRRLWPLAELESDQNQKTRYHDIAGGWRIATSVGGKATGEHPDLLIVDDAQKAQDAMSESSRTAVKEWWDGTIATRGAMRGVRRLVIGQRLHPDDLPGHILKNEPDEFVTICLPMRAEPDRMGQTPLGWTDCRRPGELLWPEGFPEERVRKVERRLGSSLNIAGQLQQRPMLLKGGLFKEEWFKWEEGLQVTEAERELDRLLLAG